MGKDNILRFEDYWDKWWWKCKMYVSWNIL